MPNRLPIASLLTSLLLASGCQSASIMPVAAECQPVPAPPAWVMEPSAPTYTRRMLEILQPSPEMPIAAP